MDMQIHSNPRCSTQSTQTIILDFYSRNSVGIPLAICLGGPPTVATTQAGLRGSAKLNEVRYNYIVMKFLAIFRWHFHPQGLSQILCIQPAAKRKHLASTKAAISSGSCEASCHGTSLVAIRSKDINCKQLLGFAPKSQTP